MNEAINFSNFFVGPVAHRKFHILDLLWGYQRGREACGGSSEEVAGL